MIPKQELSEEQMLYYAFAIESNKYKYNYGRQANRTLKDILIPKPDEIPNNFLKKSIQKPQNKSLYQKREILHSDSRKSFRYDEIFDIKK